MTASFCFKGQLERTGFKMAYVCYDDYRSYELDNYMGEGFDWGLKDDTHDAQYQLAYAILEYCGLSPELLNEEYGIVQSFSEKVLAKADTDQPLELSLKQVTDFLPLHRLQLDFVPQIKRVDPLGLTR